MTKRVLAIEDLSCVGKCSLTVALPILSAMGCSCSVLPTAVLSAHTGFQNPHIHGLTDDILPIAAHWQSAGVSFDGISVGYLSDPQQAECVGQVLEQFPALHVIDPVLGDHGKLYSGMTGDHVAAVRQLCRKGDVLLPNLTEAAILTGLPYRTGGDAVYLQELMQGMLETGARGVIVTGVSARENYTGFVGISRETGAFSYETKQIPRQLHGTGDMFAAVTLGRLVQGRALQEAAEAAAHFTEQAVENTPEETPFGAQFEQCLPSLFSGDGSDRCK